MSTPSSPFVSARTRAVSLVLGFAVACDVTASDDGGDGREDSFSADGKADGHGVPSGSFEANQVLALVNRSDLERVLDEVGISDDAAAELIAYRLGADGVAATADDERFDSLVELDAIPFVGPVAFDQLLDYALAHVEPRANLPSRRHDFAAVVGPDGLLYAMGGMGSHLERRVDAYDPATNTWSPRADLPFGGTGLAATVGPDGLIYVIGGNGNGPAAASVAAYDSTTDTWTPRASLPTGRAFATLIETGGLLYAIGGATSEALADVLVYDPDTDTWTSRASMPTPRMSVAVHELPGGELLAIGGLQQNLAHFPVFAVEVYDPVSDAWSVRADAPETVSYARSVAVDGQIMLFAPRQGLSIYDSSEDDWTVREPTRTFEELDAATVGPDGLVYLFDGQDVVGYSPATQTWYE